jgi:hypothetical protein
MLWVILAIAIVVVAFLAVALLRVRQRPLLRHSQTAPTT